jgi:hypothetical protein
MARAVEYAAQEYSMPDAVLCSPRGCYMSYAV